MTNPLIFLIQVVNARDRTGRLDALDFPCENFLWRLEPAHANTATNGWEQRRGRMFTNKALIVAAGVLVVVGLGVGAIFLQGAMDQARQTSCNYGSAGDSRCLAPYVANYGLSSDGEERKVDLKKSKSSQ
jgi:hypothetical protein